ncbi:MAG: dihydrofolate reductase family protein [Armatimonadota bacterium]|nr:dihydrofolate reductase family protein [Armatimonadota bacterium]
MRPYVVINMVATIDGKIITGERGEPVLDLGSEVDHLMMRRIQGSVDAVLIGAENQRSTPKLWYPAELTRIVATRSGNVLYPSRFFDDAPEKAIVLCTEESALPDLPKGVSIVRIGKESVDWIKALDYLADFVDIDTLLVEGGSEINAQLLERDLADELFLTLAPKIKLGANTPTYADGDPLPRNAVQQYGLVESHVWGNEVFIRYRRNRD